MKVIQLNEIDEQVDIIEEVCLTIGTFDGLHLGHIKVLTQLKQIAVEAKLKSMMISFWPHPRLIIDGNEQAPLLLNTMEEKIERLASSKLIDYLVILPFDKSLSEMDYTDFLKKILLTKFKAKHILIGYDHKFGKDRLGDFEKLENLKESLGYQLSKISEFQVDSIKTSSTAIRNLIQTGFVSKANELLGYKYSIEGTVVKGKQLGRTIGFPTANIQPLTSEKLIPSDGVYAVFVQINEKSYNGMMNIGFRPTVNGQHKTLEINIFNFSEDIYSKNICVIFLEKLRNECNFANINTLVMQLNQDKIDAVAVCKKYLL